MNKRTVFLIIDIALIILIIIFFVGSNLMDNNSLRKDWENKHSDEEINKEQIIFDTLKKKSEALIEKIKTIKNILPFREDTIKYLIKKGDSLNNLLNTKKIDIKAKNAILVQLKNVNFKLRIEYNKVLFNSYKVINIKIQNKQSKVQLNNDLNNIVLKNEKIEDFIRKYEIAHPYKIQLACYPENKKDKPCHIARDVVKLKVNVSVFGCVYNPELIYFVLCDPKKREVDTPTNKKDTTITINHKEIYVSRTMKIFKQEVKEPVEYKVSELIPGNWILKVFNSKGDSITGKVIELK